VRCRTSCSRHCDGCRSGADAGRDGHQNTNGYLLFGGFFSADGSMARDDVGDYVASNLIDPISRVNG